MLLLTVEIGVWSVGDEHVTGRVEDRQLRAGLRCDDLRRDPAGPEHRHLADAELYRVTGGNPFYVTETLRTGLDQVPRSAVDAVLARAMARDPADRYPTCGHFAATLRDVLPGDPA